MGVQTQQRGLGLGLLKGTSHTPSIHGTASTPEYPKGSHILCEHLGYGLSGGCADIPFHASLKSPNRSLKKLSLYAPMSYGNALANLKKMSHAISPIAFLALQL